MKTRVFVHWVRGLFCVLPSSLIDFLDYLKISQTKQLQPAWLFASQMVESEEVSALGISDANYLQLAAMLEEFDIKPNVDHVRVDQCCAVRNVKLFQN